MNTAKAYLPATRSQGVRVGRREGVCPGEQRGRRRANQGSPEQEDAQVLLGLRWRRKAQREGTFAPTHPPPQYLTGFCMPPLGSLPTPNLGDSQDRVVPADGLRDGCLTLQRQPPRLMVGRRDTGCLSRHTHTPQESLSPQGLDHRVAVRSQARELPKFQNSYRPEPTCRKLGSSAAGGTTAGMSNLSHGGFLRCRLLVLSLRASLMVPGAVRQAWGCRVM